MLVDFYNNDKKNTKILSVARTDDEYVSKVLAIPFLKGVAAVLVAVMQDSCDQKCTFATVAYSLIRLLDEFSDLPEDSSATSPLVIAMIVHLGLLIYEAALILRVIFIKEVMASQ